MKASFLPLVAGVKASFEDVLTAPWSLDEIPSLVLSFRFPGLVDFFFFCWSMLCGESLSNNDAKWIWSERRKVASYLCETVVFISLLCFFRLWFLLSSKTLRYLIRTVDQIKEQKDKQKLISNTTETRNIHFELKRTVGPEFCSMNTIESVLSLSHSELKEERSGPPQQTTSSNVFNIENKQTKDSQTFSSPWGCEGVGEGISTISWFQHNGWRNKQ